MATNKVDLILQKAQKLSAEELLNLIQKLTTNLRFKIKVKDESKNELSEQRGLVYGKYKNYPGPMSTEEDFKSAEYHFNENEWK